MQMARFCCMYFSAPEHLVIKFPGLGMRDPPLGPPSILAEIFWHKCLQSNLQTSPPTHQKSYPNFQNNICNNGTCHRCAHGVRHIPLCGSINLLWSFRTPLGQIGNWGSTPLWIPSRASGSWFSGFSVAPDQGVVGSEVTQLSYRQAKKPRVQAELPYPPPPPNSPLPSPPISRHIRRIIFAGFDGGLSGE
jgi:hypothetical protein